MPIRTTPYLWHITHLEVRRSILKQGLLPDQNNRVFAHQKLQSPMYSYPLILEFFTHSIQDELELLLVRIDARKLRRQWYLDPRGHELDFFQYCDNPLNFNLFVCSHGAVPVSCLEFYRFSRLPPTGHGRLIRNEVYADTDTPYLDGFNSVDAQSILYLHKIVA